LGVAASPSRKQKAENLKAGDRATEFRQRCDGLGIKGVSLDSYRYAWAERALKCGYPERFAQQALGHNSKAVDHAYSKHAEVTVPSLDDWKKGWAEKLKAETLKPEMPRPKVVAVDFTVGPVAEGDVGGMEDVCARLQS